MNNYVMHNILCILSFNNCTLRTNETIQVFMETRVTLHDVSKMYNQENINELVIPVQLPAIRKSQLFDRLLKTNVNHVPIRC